MYPLHSHGALSQLAFQMGVGKPCKIGPKTKGCSFGNLFQQLSPAKMQVSKASSLWICSHYCPCSKACCYCHMLSGAKAKPFPESADFAKSGALSMCQDSQSQANQQWLRETKQSGGFL